MSKAKRCVCFVAASASEWTHRLGFQSTRWRSQPPNEDSFLSARQKTRLAAGTALEQTVRASAAESRRSRWLRWMPGVVAVLLLPKCLACVAGYFALAASLGFAGAEICGANETDMLMTLGARIGLSPRQTAWTVVGVVAAWLAVLTPVAYRCFRRVYRSVSETKRVVR